MANTEHLKILKQGVEVWNQWRLENPDVRPDLSDAKLSKEHLGNTKLYAQYLFGANLQGINLSKANLKFAILRCANLQDSNLQRADLYGADLSRANLSNASLQGATLYDVELFSADLSNTSLVQAKLNGANFRNAHMLGTNFQSTNIGETHFGNNNLANAIGLESAQHSGPSTIGIDTIYKSGGNIPEVFLRGCGVPDTFITFARSLVGTAIDYDSAFISYSSRNHDFAERLHTDLQSKGVRCWFASEDLKIGDPFRQRIDEAIRIYDKLLLILSEDSMASAWVADEVEAAFERERRENRLMLFPVRIDGAIEQSTTAWAASLRRTRHIGDFTNWKDHDSYCKAFDRLLRDLKSETTA